MPMEVMRGVLIPFLGTTLGSACVLFMKKTLRSSVQRALTGFAAGVMVAASIWNLLIPEMSAGGHSNLGTVFFALGFMVMLALDVALDEVTDMKSKDNKNFWGKWAARYDRAMSGSGATI